MNHYLSFQIHGNADHSGSGLVDILNDLLIFLSNLPSQSGGEIFSHLLPGIAALENIHPLLVHFPLAFLLSFVVVDMLACVLKKPAWRKSASWLLYFGTVTTLFTVIAGLVAANSVPHGENVHEIMERHEHLGITALLLTTGLSAWRWFAKDLILDELNILYLIFEAILAIVLVLGADLGGLMVYRYGVAVKAVPEPANGYFQQHQHHH